MTACAHTHEPVLTLSAATARDLMTPDPVSVPAYATVRKATGLLLDAGFSALPVVDGNEKPLGVLSRTDVLRHERERTHYIRLATKDDNLGPGYHLEQIDGTTVDSIMTPVVYAVTPDTPSEDVIREILERRVHRLFVAGDDGKLLGVISAIDVLAKLNTEI